jgi:3-(3-hydroxy-phenyl)propionate hydroxylase
MPAETAPIVIVGGGPVGLMLANLLGRQNVPVIVVEKRGGCYTIPRAISYDAETLRLFQTIGLEDAIAPALLLDLPVLYFDANRRCFLQMRRRDRPYGHSSAGSFYQPDLEAALIEGLSKLPSVDLRFGQEVKSISQSATGVELSVATAGGDETRIRGAYIVACDGGSSPTRTMLNIGFGGFTFDEKWLVVDTVDTGYDAQQIEIFCDPARPALTVPVANGRRRWEFLLKPGEANADLEDEATIRRMIAHYAPEDRSEFERAQVYTFHARLADTYRHDRILLAGDAAHVMPPFAGQGLNSGMRDTANLAWKLELVWRGIANATLLNSYEQERREHVRVMTALAIRLGRIMMPTSRIRAYFRSGIFAITNRIPGRQAQIDSGSMVPKPILPKGSALGPIGWGKRSGHMLPQPDIKLVDGGIAKLDELLGPGFALLGLGVDPLNALHPADRNLADQLGARAVQVGGEKAMGQDSSNTLQSWLGFGDRILLVRPDKYVAAVFRPDNGRQMLGRFAKGMCLSKPFSQVSGSTDPARNMMTPAVGS